MSQALAKRADDAVARLAAAWGETSPSDRRWYDESVRAWLASVASSPHTTRSYTTTIAGFFAWAEASGRARVPHRVTTSDVEAWVTFLEAGGRTVPPTLDREERAALDAVSNGRGGREAIARAIDQTRFLNGLLASASAHEVSVLMGRLATKGLVTRDRSAFRGETTWKLPAPRQGGLAPATVGQRLAALQSFFAAVIGQDGQKAGLSDRGPMTVSPVPPVLTRYVKRTANSRVVRSERRKTRPVDWEALRNACWERNRPDGWKQRDWTILVCLATTGLRVAELCRLRLKDIESVPAPDAGDAGGRVTTVVVTRKGGREDRIALPEIAQKEILALRTALRPEDQAGDRPIACMAVRRWGKQAALPTNAALSTTQVQTIFRGLAKQIAKDTGEDAKTVEQRIHPHGLRHLYAETLADAGVPVHEIRDLLGHQSLATTDGYLSRRKAGTKDHSNDLKPFAWPSDDAGFAMNGAMNGARNGKRGPRPR